MDNWVHVLPKYRKVLCWTAKTFCFSKFKGIKIMQSVISGPSKINGHEGDTAHSSLPLGSLPMTLLHGGLLSSAAGSMIPRRAAGPSSPLPDRPGLLRVWPWPSLMRVGRESRLVKCFGMFPRTGRWRPIAQEIRPHSCHSGHFHKRGEMLAKVFPQSSRLGAMLIQYFVCVHYTVHQTSRTHWLLMARFEP